MEKLNERWRMPFLDLMAQCVTREALKVREFPRSQVVVTAKGAPLTLSFASSGPFLVAVGQNGLPSHKAFDLCPRCRLRVVDGAVDWDGVVLLAHEDPE